MRKSLILLIPLLLALAYAKGRNSGITSHNHQRSPNYSAADIFSPKRTEKECIKCLPDNFCECECSCKNKTGFSMKYRNASKGPKLHRDREHTNGTYTDPRSSIALSTKRAKIDKHTEIFPPKGINREERTTSVANTDDDKILECFSSCKSVTGIQTEECSCSCFC
ncbi:secreted ookinete adhesive protein [Plasmodium gonderi]|uniref:Secreted ookinete adhesive protein n=1 Tax=Plasmodium gonderi TaxID=77519 RepID=A0A1Y1JL59_PLAGO|nr:secreted ookinete adhesive protein [Plasmodium gonderi]GAW83171.1 secreted ookinete adhesive protein [Plasmodium gonderi]